MSIVSTLMGALSLNISSELLAVTNNASEVEIKNVKSILEKRLDLEKQKRESLVDIKKHVIFAELNKDKVITAEAVIDILLVFVRCLKKVATSLSTIVLFCELLSQYYKKLSQSTMPKLINDIEKSPREERIEIFTNSDLIDVFVRYVSQWSAMYYVSDKHSYESELVRDKCLNDLQNLFDNPYNVQLIQERAMIIMSNIEKQIQNSDARIIEIEEQIKQLIHVKKL